MLMNSSQQFFSQISILTSTNFLTILTETNRSIPFDPLTEIRNGLNIIFFFFKKFSN